MENINQNKGIDYGFGQTNIDAKTGISYGVISQNAVCQAWSDYSEPEYGPATCPDCDNEVTIANDGTYHCAVCDKDIDEDDMASEMQEPLAFLYDTDGYHCSQSADDTDISVLGSPYYTLCQFCSPCAPGAGYILNPVKNGVKAYCFGHDWFEDGIAPYPVYRVADDKQVIAERKDIPCNVCHGIGYRSTLELAKVRDQSIQECECDILNGTIPAKAFNPNNHTIACFRCNGSGKVNKVIETVKSVKA